MDSLVAGLFQMLGSLLLVMAIIAAIAIAGLLLMIRSLRDIEVPPDADLFTTMHYVPITLVILLDMLDLGLDVFSAPVSWIILDRMGLASLRNVATVEGIIPLTGPIPTLTATWLLARLFNLGDPTMRSYAARRSGRAIEDRSYEEDDRPPQRRKPVRIIDMDER